MWWATKVDGLWKMAFGSQALNRGRRSTQRRWSALCGTSLKLSQAGLGSIEEL
jgi:hypothetical protein